MLSGDYRTIYILYIIIVVSSVLLLSDTEHLMLYIILVVPLLVCWKNQVRGT